MILYIEHQAKNYSQTHHLMSRFPDAEVVYIKHYKNLFDKRLTYKTKDCLLIARLTWKAMLPVPESYGYGSQSFFLRTALNCVFDCEYCYLKGAFRNDFPVYFVNYDEIKEQVVDMIARKREEWVEGDIWIYPSNRTDLLGAEHLTYFHREFLPFFDTLGWVQVESRTKSTSIKQLLCLPVPKNTEIAYSLSPQSLIDEHEKWTPPVHKRYKAINVLLDAWWRVWLRLMPLLPVEWYETVYSDFFDELKREVDISRCSSLFFWWFLLTKKDFSTMKKKNPDSLLWWHLTEKDESSLWRTPSVARTSVYNLCKKHFPSAKISFDEL